MNILYINHTSKVGGAERSLFSLIEVIHWKHNVMVILFEDGDYADELRSIGVSVKIIPVNPKVLYLKRTKGVLSLVKYFYAFFYSSVLVSKIVNKIDYDIIHINSFKSLILLVFLVKKGPVIFHSRDFYSGIIPRLLLRFAISRVNVVISNSSFIQNNIPKKDGEKSIVIHNGFRINKDRYSDECIAWPRLRNQIVFGIIGELSFSKGIDRVINIYNDLKWKFNREILFYIYGKSNFNKKSFIENLIKQIDDNGYQENIVFKGYEPNVETIMAAIDIVLIIPRVPESFGRTAVEGMLYNKVVFAEKKGGVTDIVDGDKHGFYWSDNISDNIITIKKLIENEKETIKSINETRIYVANKFNIDRKAEEVIQLYEALI